MIYDDNRRNWTRFLRRLVKNQIARKDHTQWVESSPKEWLTAVRQASTALRAEMSIRKTRHLATVQIRKEAQRSIKASGATWT